MPIPKPRRQKAIPPPNRERQVRAMVGFCTSDKQAHLVGLVGPGNPAAVLLLQKLHCHPGERVSSGLLRIFDTGDDPDSTTALTADFNIDIA